MGGAPAGDVCGGVGAGPRACPYPPRLPLYLRLNAISETADDANGVRRIVKRVSSAFRRYCGRGPGPQDWLPNPDCAWSRCQTVSGRGL